MKQFPSMIRYLFFVLIVAAAIRFWYVSLQLHDGILPPSIEDDITTIPTTTTRAKLLRSNNLASIQREERVTSTTTTELTNKKDESINSDKQIKDTVTTSQQGTNADLITTNTITNTTAATSQPPFTWSACMMTRDENMALPEWLAYHIQVLPLKKLVIGLDPHSMTDPRPILDQFQKTMGLEYKVLTVDKFFREGQQSFKKRNFTHAIYKNGTSVKMNSDQLWYAHLWRQNLFYQSCLSMLHRSGDASWTLFLDADEYLTYNPYSPLDISSAMPGCTRRNTTCRELYHERMQRDLGGHVRTRIVPVTTNERRLVYPPSRTVNTSTIDNSAEAIPAKALPPSTIAHFLNQSLDTLIEWNENYALPCWGLERLSFGAITLPNDNDSSSNSIPPLKTLQYRLYPTRTMGNNGAKCLVNVRHADFPQKRVPRVESPHAILSRHRCKNAPHGTLDDVLKVHHYASSFDEYVARGKGWQDFLSRQPKPHIHALHESYDATWWWPAFVERLEGNETLAWNLTVGLTEWARQDYMTQRRTQQQQNEVLVKPKEDNEEEQPAAMNQTNLFLYEHYNVTRTVWNYW
eukprot:CAMPEP_0178911216 /NCGR_PEP_ID=MMETSP0786-20121207/9566_1 /TAXON_ID=186022 /ORGANISM="Thalassionema frauenfeldii, Strain CCMP 1798" /LENGTH=576 /DNA_ID=CAMNT_0020583627 /DNA_START=185 /DNA_END=1912 /DNA_ORIENTATION=-